VTPFEDQTSPDEATVRAYLVNILDAARAVAFEDYCLGHPHFARRVEMDLYLTRGFRHLQEANALQRTHPPRRVMFAVAASLTVIVVCGLLLLLGTHPLTLVAYRSAPDVPSALRSGPRVSVTLVSLRERSTEHRVVAPQDTGVLALRVMPDSPPGPSGYMMEVGLESAIIARSVTVDKLKADNDGFVEIYLPLAAVVGHTLRVAVTPAPGPGTPPLVFRLRVAAPFSTPDETR
jgi:hypothetical protein